MEIYLARLLVRGVNQSLAKLVFSVTGTMKRNSHFVIKCINREGLKSLEDRFYTVGIVLGGDIYKNSER